MPPGGSSDKWLVHRALELMRRESKGVEPTMKLWETLGPAKKGRGQADSKGLWHKRVIWQPSPNS